MPSGNQFLHILKNRGHDCPGAVSITPYDHLISGEHPGVFPDHYLRVSIQLITRIVNELHQCDEIPSDQIDPSPLPGIQPKIALLYNKGSFYMPREGSGAPTTHILKVSPQYDRDITRHESALLSLASLKNIFTAVPTRCQFLNEQDKYKIEALISPRFDRRIVNGEIVKIHCEDAAQFNGIDSDLKYERNRKGGQQQGFNASMIKDMALKMDNPNLFLIDFMRHTLFNLLVGNTDNHAKNCSIIYKDGNASLAPLYDVVPVFMCERTTHELAFMIGDAAFAEDVTRDDLMKFAHDIGIEGASFAMFQHELQHMAEGACEYLEKKSGKDLADAMASQLRVIEYALKINLNVPNRDTYLRRVRDEPIKPIVNQQKPVDSQEHDKKDMIKTDEHVVQENQIKPENKEPDSSPMDDIFSIPDSTQGPRAY